RRTCCSPFGQVITSVASSPANSPTSMFSGGSHTRLVSGNWPALTIQSSAMNPGTIPNSIGESNRTSSIFAPGLIATISLRPKTNDAGTSVVAELENNASILTSSPALRTTTHWRSRAEGPPLAEEGEDEEEDRIGVNSANFLPNANGPVEAGSA